MQTTINQSITAKKETAANAETRLLLFLITLGVAGLIFLFSRTTEPDMRGISQVESVETRGTFGTEPAQLP